MGLTHGVLSLILNVRKSGLLSMIRKHGNVFTVQHGIYRISFQYKSSIRK